MRRSARLLPLAMLILLSTAAAEVRLQGSVGLDAGTLDHPLGLADEPASFLRSGRLDLTAVSGGDGSYWRGTYAGSLDLFDDDVPLDYVRHAVGLERIQGRGQGRPALGFGLQWSTRRQLDDASPYDHVELDGYFTRKSYPLPDVMLRAVVGARLRTFADLPEESFVEPHAQLEAKRFGEDRSTLGATLRLGGKWYHDDAAASVWGTDGTPRAAQLAVTLQYARGLSDRVGVRASAGQRVALADFPYWVQDDLVDNPLLDRYARSGPTAFAAIKLLGPAAVWLDTGVRWSEDDYGAILFDGGDGPAERDDTVLQAHATLEKNLSSAARGTVLRFTALWRDQDSNVPAYSWRGVTLVGGVDWTW